VAQTIAVTSYRGTVGTGTLAAALADELAGNPERRVAYLDATGNPDSVTPCSRVTTRRLSGRSRIPDTRTKAAAAYHQLAGAYDYLLLDAPAAVDVADPLYLQLVAPHADRTLVHVNPRAETVADTLEWFEAAACQPAGERPLNFDTVLVVSSTAPGARFEPLIPFEELFALHLDPHARPNARRAQQQASLRPLVEQLTAPTAGR